MGVFISWISDNIGTIMICAVLLIIFALLILGLIRDKKKAAAKGGCTGCCSCCSGCHCGYASVNGEAKNRAENKKTE